MNFHAIDVGATSPLRRLLLPAMPLVSGLGRRLWRLSRARRSTWFDKTLLWHGLWNVNRLVGCVPRTASSEVEVAVAGGVRMRLDLSRLSDALCYVYGAGESEIGFLCSRLCAADGVVYDVGANVGTTTLFFARCVPRGHVHSFEPSLQMREVLQRNIALNGITNVSVHAFGLSDRASKGSLQLAHAGNPGSAFFIDGGDGGDVVDVRTMDAGMAGHAPPTFVKIDVEGLELRVLRGGANTITAHRPALIVEINRAALERAGTDTDAVAALLRQWGYRLLFLHRGRFRELDPRHARDPRLYNMIAVHPGHERQWQVVRQHGLA